MEKLNEKFENFPTIDSHCWLRRWLFSILCKFSGFRGGSVPPVPPPLAPLLVNSWTVSLAPHFAAVCFLHYPNTIPTLSNFVSKLSQKFEPSTQRTKLISYENGMVLYYSNNTMNKYRFICIYVWINTIIICISSVSSSSVAAPGGNQGNVPPPVTRKICKGLGTVHVSASNENR